MNTSDPLAFFITWTIYGTHLQGSERGWRRRGRGTQAPQPLLEEWHRERLKHPIIRLSCDQRKLVEAECRNHCLHRQWRLWEVNARTTHVHVVVTARNYSGGEVRDQLKANCTRGLRNQWNVFQDRPVWSVGGDWECINSEDDLNAVCEYVRDAQDRKGRE